MGLIYTDSFDLGSSASPGAEKVRVMIPGATQFAGAGTTGGSSVVGRHQNGSAYGAVVPGSQYTAIVDSECEDSIFILGCALFRSAAGTNGNTILSFDEWRYISGTTASQFAQITITNNTSATGKMDVRLGSSGGTVLGSFTTPFSAWYYLEVKVKIHASAGYVVVRVNESTVLNLTSINTLGNTSTGTTGILNAVTFSDVGFSMNLQIDDLYLLNSSGSTNNDFLGDCTIVPLRPTGAGSFTQWTPSAGSNWDAVADPYPTGMDASDYVSSSTVGNKDSYAAADLTQTSPYTVAGVMVYAIADKSDTGTRKIAATAKLAGNEVQSPDRTLYNTAETANNIARKAARLAMDTNPAGGAWSISDVNSLEVGVKVTL